MVNEMISFSMVIQLLVVLGGLAGVWNRVQVKLRELDMKLLLLETRINSVEKIDEKILDKLDQISEQLSDLKIELNNKQDKQ